MSYPGIAEGFTHQGEFTPDNLIAGQYPLSVGIEPVSASVPLPAGAVLGRITASGVYQLSDASSSDGSHIPDAILLEAIEGAGGVVEAHILLRGEINSDALMFGPGHTLASIRLALRERSIFLRKNQS